jgi:hypothetical protein
MGWYTLSGRHVGWAAGLLTSQPPEHFVYPDYPSSVSWFAYIPFLNNIRFQFPGGINPLELLGYRHPAGSLITLVPAVNFTLDFYLQQGTVLPFIDAVFSNAQWESWDEDLERPVPNLPLPFTFIFSVRNPSNPSQILRQVICPYAYISRLRGSVEEGSQALRLQVDFATPLLQLISSDFLAVFSSYDPTMPIPLIREVTTEDFGQRLVTNFNFELTNQIEFVYSSWRTGQPIDLLRVPDRLVYRGSQIQVNVSLLHPHHTSPPLSSDYSYPLFDFQFVINYRYGNSSFEKRLLKFYQGRRVSIDVNYSVDGPAVENVNLIARYLRWEEVR